MTEPLPIGSAVPTDDDQPTVADTLDALRDVAHTLWALVDDVTPFMHAEHDGPRRLELRAVQEHTAQAWAQAQHAVTVLQTLVALDRPEVCPVADDLDHLDGCECRRCTDGPWQRPADDLDAAAVETR